MSHSNNPNLPGITDKNIKNTEMTYPVTQIQTLTLVSPHPSKVSSFNSPGLQTFSQTIITIHICSSQALEDDMKLNEISDSTPKKVQE
jgi:hypothetical protein